GNQFVLNDKTFYFTGSNTYYLHYFHIDRCTPEIFQIAKKHGFKVMRTWAFMDIKYEYEMVYYSSFNNQTHSIEINEGEKGLKRLDQVIAYAEQQGIRLILTLTNNWADFGGMEAWVKYYGYENHYDFYTAPELKEEYKRYVKTIINRVNTVTGKKYKEDGTIFAWELANEPRCRGVEKVSLEACTPATVNKWLDEMSTYIRELDPNHLISSGEEGFGLAGVDDELEVNQMIEGTDFRANTALKNVDFATVHLYVEGWGFKDYEKEVELYLKSRAEVAKKELNKPIVMEEFG
ncbi:glycoside hydrolase family 5 protein, partial [Piromyces sp. E2]